MKTGRETDALPVLAVDIGGTKILAALVSAAGEIAAAERRLTEAGLGPQSVTERVLSTIGGLLRDAGVAAAGLHSISIGAAGAIDARSGIVTTSPSLPGWSNIPLRDAVETEFGVRTFILNDASAAVLGEHRYGAGRGCRDIVYITVSTGIGGGIMIDGRLHGGASGSAGEIGHMVVDVDGRECNCGGIGCLETLASGAAVARDAASRVASGQKSSLLEMAGGDPQGITSEMVGAAAKQGDPVALDVVTTAGRYLGIGLAGVVNLLNPEVIIVGGGLSRMGDLLLDPVRRAVRERAFRLPAEAMRIVVAQLGDNSGVIGAAVFARET